MDREVGVNILCSAYGQLPLVRVITIKLIQTILVHNIYSVTVDNASLQLHYTVNHYEQIHF